MIQLYRKYFLSFAASIVLTLPMAGFANSSGDVEAEESFAQARQYLEQSNDMGEEADQKIIDANRTRKRINQLRAQSRKTPDNGSKKQLAQTTAILVDRLRHLQTHGSELRQQSKALYYSALNLFEQGAVTKWEHRILSRNPLAMDDSTSVFIAHNTKFRSVHPNMLNKMGTPTETIDPESVDNEMSILVPALAGQNAPKNLDIRSFQLSRDRHYLAHIEVKPDGEKVRDSLVPFNKIHRWILLISDLSGTPVENADIEVVGHMPGHVHGLPTQPRVTAELAPGVYQVEGLKFQMKGWWVMQFNIATDAGAKHSITPETQADSVTFNLVL